MPYVLLIVGSPNDLPIVKGSKMLEVFRDCYAEVLPNVISAHRNPEELRTFLNQRPVPFVAICVAGMTNALAGNVSAHYEGRVPVIGVVLSSSPLDGIDALLSCTRMPPGRPVLCTGLDKPGLYNAAIAACSIIGAYDAEVRERLKKYQGLNNKPPQFDVDMSTIDAK